MPVFRMRILAPHFTRTISYLVWDALLHRPHPALRATLSRRERASRDTFS
jgi:hypothetical protein